MGEGEGGEGVVVQLWAARWWCGGNLHVEWGGVGLIWRVNWVKESKCIFIDTKS